ncbi:single-stranded DNA-binding protein [Patescibacteria group bacterium]|nr:single-stranded DNA-binding protein [Patescibacteria group bacterium]MBU3922708.1 single-stranded DNA-binding protein [Patescibacteria group bacterium]
MNLNKIFIIGRLTRDPESRTLPSGQGISNFGMATNRAWTNKETKEKQEQTEFHNIVAFGKLADICNQYLKKGSLAMIEGRIQTRSWQDQGGDTKYKTEIVAESLQMGPRSQKSESTTKEAKEEEIPEIQVDEEEIKNEDIPF